MQGAYPVEGGVIEFLYIGSTACARVWSCVTLQDNPITQPSVGSRRDGYGVLVMNKLLSHLSIRSGHDLARPLI